MTPYEVFQWQETSPGCWTREIDEIERFYYALVKLYEASGRKFFFMTGHLSLKMKIPDPLVEAGAEEYFQTALRKAWVALRFALPTIASQTRWDARKQRTVKEYRVDDSNWTEETTVFVSTGQTGREWANSDPPAPDRPTLFVVKPPTDKNQNYLFRDIVFRAPHDVIDGIGTLHMLNHLVHLLADALALGERYQIPNLNDPKVIQNLSPPFRVAAAVPPEPTELIQKRLAELAADAKSHDTKNVEAISLPYKKGPILPGKHQRVELARSQAETSKILAACRRAGVTVTHAYHAAIALALRELQVKCQQPRQVQYVNYILRNERESCRPPYNSSAHAAAVYHSTSGQKLVVDMTVPAVSQTRDSVVDDEEQRSEFLRVLEQIKTFYHVVRNDTLHYALVPYIWAKGTPEIPLSAESNSQTLPVPPPRDIAQVSISSMGRIDGIITPTQGPVECFDPWVTGEELGNGFGLFLGTFRGELSLSSAYNDAWHDRGEALEFLKRCADIVDKCLVD